MGDTPKRISEQPVIAGEDVKAGDLLTVVDRDNVTLAATGTNSRVRTDSFFGAKTLPSANAFDDGDPDIIVLHDCETTTGWDKNPGGAAVGLDNSSTPSSTTVRWTTGTRSVRFSFPMSSTACFGRFNLAVPVTNTAGYDRILFDIQFQNTDGSRARIGERFRAKVTDAVDFGGNAVYGYIPKTIPDIEGLGADEAVGWYTVSVPIHTLTTIRCVGIIGDLGTAETGGGRMWIWIDNVRLAPSSKIDQAQSLGYQLVIPDSYTTGVVEQAKAVASLANVDLRDGREHIGRLNGVRYAREWNIPEDGLTECTSELNAAIEEAYLQGAHTFEFTPNAFYNCDARLLFLDYRDFTVRMNNASVFPRVWLGGSANFDDPQVEIEDCRRMTIQDGHFYGFREVVNLGSALTNDGGSPTTSGSTKLLDAQDEAVRCPNHAQSPAGYGRLPWVAFSSTIRTLITAYDSDFTFGCAVTFTLSDSNQVASDCIIEAIDGGTDGVLATRTITLTSTPTEYVLAFDPPDIERTWKWRVRKSTATANTITVTSNTEVNPVLYQGSHDGAPCFAFNGSQQVTLRNMHVESAITDSIDLADPDTYDLVIDGWLSRACNRQGISFNQATRVTLRNFHIILSGRSLIDIEPFQVDWFIHDLVIENGRLALSGSGFFGISAGNWGGIKDLTIRNLVIRGTGQAECFTGGSQRFNISQIDGNSNDIQTGGHTIEIMGTDVRGSDINCETIDIDRVATVLAINEEIGYVEATWDSSTDEVTITNSEFLVTDWDYVNPIGAVTPSVIGGGISAQGQWVAGAPTASNIFKLIAQSQPQIVQAASGDITTMNGQIGDTIDCDSASTVQGADHTIAAASNGVNTSTFAGAGVLHVSSIGTQALGTFTTTGGTVFVATGGTRATITYTGVSNSGSDPRLTGCTTTAGGGVMSTGGYVRQGGNIVVETSTGNAYCTFDEYPITGGDGTFYYVNRVSGAAAGTIDVGNRVARGPFDILSTPTPTGDMLIAQVVETASSNIYIENGTYASVSVTVPGITDPDIASVNETVTGVTAGDLITASPTAAFADANARFLGAYSNADDTVTFVFSSVGGDVTTEELTFNVKWSRP